MAALFEELSTYFCRDLLEIAELSTEESRTLLTNLAPRVVQAESNMVQPLLDAVGGLPLAVMLMGSYLHKEAASGQPRRVQKALEKLRVADERLRHEEVQQVRDYHPSLSGRARVSLEAIVAVSDDALTAEARQTLYTLALFPPKPNSFSEDAALAVSGKRADDELYLLEDYSLLESNEPGRYMLHQVIVDYARAKPIDDAARERMIRYFADYTEQYVDDYDSIVAEYGNLVAALDQPSILNRSGRIPILMALAKVEGKRGNYEQVDRYAAEGLHLARTTEDPQAICLMLLKLNAIAVIQGQYEKADAYAQEGLDLARKTGKPKMVAHLLDNVGVALASQWEESGDPEKLEQARRSWQDGLEISRKNQYDERICGFAANLGILAIELGEYEQASPYLDEALQMAIQLDDPWHISGISIYKGELFLKQQQIEAAATEFDTALRISKERGFEEMIAEALFGQARVAGAQGDGQKARALGQESLQRYKALNHTTAGKVEGWLSSL